MLSLVFLLFRDGVPVALLALWAASVCAVRADARLRVSNRAGVRAAVLLAALLPFLGAFVYCVLRPTETRIERRERWLARLLLELEVGSARPLPANVVALPAREPGEAGEVDPAKRRHAVAV